MSNSITHFFDAERNKYVVFLFIYNVISVLTNNV